jgi:hypothetical protein
MKLRESHSSLPAEQQQFLRDKRVESTWTPVQWLGFLGSLADWDARADATRGKTGRKLWMTILFGILVVVAVSIVLSPIDGAVLAVILVVAVVVLTRAWRSARKLDLPGEQLRFAATIVNVLAEDVAPTTTGLYVRLDLRGATHDSKKTQVTPQYRRGPYHKCVDTFYVDPWFSGSATLVDEANLYWHVVDRTRSSKRTKRNPRGKIKTKTKVKKTTFLQVGLQLPAKNYAVHQQGEAVTPDGAGGATKVKVKPAESRANIKLTRTMKSAGGKGLADPQELVALMADAYGRGDPARRKRL